MSSGGMDEADKAVLATLTDQILKSVVVPIGGFLGKLFNLFPADRELNSILQKGTLPDDQRRVMVVRWVNTTAVDRVTIGKIVTVWWSLRRQQAAHRASPNPFESYMVKEEEMEPRYVLFEQFDNASVGVVVFRLFLSKLLNLFPLDSILGPLAQTELRDVNLIDVKTRTKAWVYVSEASFGKITRVWWSVYVTVGAHRKLKNPFPPVDNKNYGLLAQMLDYLDDLTGANWTQFAGKLTGKFPTDPVISILPIGGDEVSAQLTVKAWLAANPAELLQTVSTLWHEVWTTMGAHSRQPNPFARATFSEAEIWGTPEESKVDEGSTEAAASADEELMCSFYGVIPQRSGESALVDAMAIWYKDQIVFQFVDNYASPVTGAKTEARWTHVSKTSLKTYMAKWTHYADRRLRLGIQFVDYDDLPVERRPAKADLRIAYCPGLWQSAVGTAAANVAADQPTAFLGEVSSRKNAHHVLHEIGHMLGLKHEHQSDQSKLKFNLPALKIYCNRQGWNEETMKTNILTTFETNLYAGDTYDRDSIMHYHFPPHVFDPPKALPENKVISKGDFAATMQLYPVEGDEKSRSESREAAIVKYAAGMNSLDPAAAKELRELFQDMLPSIQQTITVQGDYVHGNQAKNNTVTGSLVQRDQINNFFYGTQKVHSRQDSISAEAGDAMDTSHDAAASERLVKPAVGKVRKMKDYSPALMQLLWNQIDGARLATLNAFVAQFRTKFNEDQVLQDQIESGDFTGRDVVLKRERVKSLVNDKARRTEFAKITQVWVDVYGTPEPCPFEIKASAGQSSRVSPGASTDGSKAQQLPGAASEAAPGGWSVSTGDADEKRPQPDVRVYEAKVLEAGDLLVSSYVFSLVHAVCTSGPVERIQTLCERLSVNADPFVRAGQNPSATLKELTAAVSSPAQASLLFDAMAKTNPHAPGVVAVTVRLVAVQHALTTLHETRNIDSLLGLTDAAAKEAQRRKADLPPAEVIKCVEWLATVKTLKIKGLQTSAAALLTDIPASLLQSAQADLSFD